MIAQNGITIKYGNIAPGAKENFVVETMDKEPFVNLAQFQEYNLAFKNYGNPIEMYSVALDGEALPFPSAPENENFGLWSEQISGDDGVFAEPIVLELNAEGNYSSQSLTFTFDNFNNIFATKINIKWYRDEELLEEGDFYPDNAVFSCEKTVENYNRVIITFYSINMPKNRLKLRVIDYGYGTFFYGKDLRAVKINQQINPASTEIVINTADFTLDLRGEKQYLFQEKQPIEIYFNGKLRSTAFLKSAKRQNETSWKISAEDYIGILEDAEFYGDMYENKNAVELLGEIFSKARVPFAISDDLRDATVSGLIPMGNCRKALMQVLIAIGAVANTADRDAVEIYKLSDEVKQNIPLKRIMQGQSVTDGDKVTSVSVTAHSYEKTDEVEKIYQAEKQGVGDEIFLKFSNPLHSLSITNGEILQSSATYAVINASAGCVFEGKKYNEYKFSKEKKNPLVTANTKQKVSKVDNATLVTPSNVDNVLESCYNYFMRTRTAKAKIIEGKTVTGGERYRYGEIVYGSGVKYGEKSPKITILDTPTAVGETNSIETNYLGILTGQFVKQSFSLAGGIIIKDTEIRI